MELIYSQTHSGSACSMDSAMATYKMGFPGLDPAQLPIADLDTAPRGSLKIEELEDHLV